TVDRGDVEDAPRHAVREEGPDRDRGAPERRQQVDGEDLLDFAGARSVQVASPARAARSRTARSATSPRTTVPAAPSRSRKRAAPASVRSTPTTDHPSAASRSEIAKPIPLPAPVTTATLMVRHLQLQNG